MKMNNEKTIKVWDIFVRLFHWTLVASFVIAYLTQEEENLVHIYSGYTVLCLVVFRLLWGIIGTKYARFSDFVRSPKEVAKYVKELINKKPPRYIGHNPAGGWMIIALLMSLLVVTMSGLKIYAIEEGRGPLAKVNSELFVIGDAYADRDEHDDDDDEYKYKSYGEYEEKENHEQDEEFWEEIHELSTNITLLLILLHITGVVVSGKLHRENLVKSMITGKKKA